MKTGKVESGTWRRVPRMVGRIPIGGVVVVGIAAAIAISAITHSDEKKPKHQTTVSTSDSSSQNTSSELSREAKAAARAAVAVLAPPIAEHPGSVGYRFVRKLRASGSITNFEPMKPKTGWDDQYRLNGGAGIVRFKQDGDSRSIEAQAVPSLLSLIKIEAVAEGFNSSG